MKPLRIPGSRRTLTLLHVVLPSASLLVLASMFWIGFSGQRQPIVQSAREASGATNLTYSGELAGGGSLTFRAEEARFRPSQIEAVGVEGSIVYPDGYVRRFTSQAANAGWDLSYAGFEGGTFTEILPEGAALSLWLESGSAGSNGLVGRKVSATLERENGLRQEFVAEQLFVKADGSSASVSGGAAVTWSGTAAADWLTVRSDGFAVYPQDSLLESAGAAEFEFLSGRGTAGKLRVSDGGRKVELLDGIEISYLDPVSDTD